MCQPRSLPRATHECEREDKRAPQVPLAQSLSQDQRSAPSALFAFVQMRTCTPRPLPGNSTARTLEATLRACQKSA
jgi:hypothetical protein